MRIALPAHAPRIRPDMTQPTDSDAADAELLSRIGETSLRMMAGVVSPSVVQHLQARLYAEPDEYPWEEVVDSVLAEPMARDELVNRGLVGQRNWLLKSGRDAAPGGQAVAGGGQSRRGRSKTMKVRGKTLLAMMIVRGGFFVIYTFAVVLLLVLLRHKFPSFDIYRILDLLKQLLPSVFGG